MNMSSVGRGKTSARSVVLTLHRWVGLGMALFLLIEGISGAMLSFRGPLTRFFDPALFATAPSSTARRLDLATLIDAAQAAEPQREFHWFLPMGDDVALVYLVPKTGLATRASIAPLYLALDPWRGRVIRRMDARLYSDQGVLTNVMPFVYDLHKTLALGSTGIWILAITALVWTLDSLWAVYLTLPRGFNAFWRRWKPAWQIKWRARWPRINYDLHRAGSLWVWIPMLLFAWSSVALVDNFGAFANTMTGIFGPNTSATAAFFERQTPRATPVPALDWHQALDRGETLAQTFARRDGYAVAAPDSLWYDPHSHQYSIRLRTSRRFPEDRDLIFYFDGDTGAPGPVIATTDGTRASITTDWLIAFHMIGDPFDYTVYRIVVCVLGILLAAVSTTGVVLWAAKRRGR